MQKLYCYIDESGQDVTSHYFIVVAVVCIENQAGLQNQLVAVEAEAKTHGLKWQKSAHERRVRYLSLILERKIAAGKVFFGVFLKPVQYFSPVLYVAEKAIQHNRAVPGYNPD